MYLAPRNGVNAVPTLKTGADERSVRAGLD